MASFAEEGQKSSAAAVPVEDPDDDDDKWDLNCVAGLDDMEVVNENRPLIEYEKSCRSKKRKVSRTVAEALVRATKLVHWEVFADKSLSTELVSIHGALVDEMGSMKTLSIGCNWHYKLNSLEANF